MMITIIFPIKQCKIYLCIFQYLNRDFLINFQRNMKTTRNVHDMYVYINIRHVHDVYWRTHTQTFTHFCIHSVMYYCYGFNCCGIERGGINQVNDYVLWIWVAYRTHWCNIRFAISIPCVYMVLQPLPTPYSCRSTILASLFWKLLRTDMATAVAAGAISSSSSFFPRE